MNNISFILLVFIYIVIYRWKKYYIMAKLKKHYWVIEMPIVNLIKLR